MTLNLSMPDAIFWSVVVFCVTHVVHRFGSTTIIGREDDE